MARRGRRGFRRGAAKRKGKFLTVAKFNNWQRQNIEPKFAELNVPSGGFDNQGYVICLTNIAQGTTDQERVGDKILPKSIHMRYKLTATDAQNLMRIIIFRWHPVAATGGAPPAAADILFQLTGTANAPLDGYEVDSRSQFAVLYDRCHNLNTTDKTSVLVNKFIKCGKIPVKYDAGTTTAADHLWLFIISDSGAIAHPTFQGTARLLYNDL